MIVGMPWSPMQALEKVGDVHEMYDRGFRVALIRRVEIRRPHAWLWRSVTGEQDPAERSLIGYFPSLEMAASVTWKMWVQYKTPIEQRSLL